MKRFLATLSLTLALAAAVIAQTVVTTGEAQLFERPDLSSAVKTILPVGLELDVISEQSDWVAVRLKTGTVGWIRSVFTSAGGAQQSTYSPPTPQPAQPEPQAEDTEDLLRSIRDLAEEESAEPTPPPGPPQQPTYQQPPAQQPPPATQQPPTQQAPPPTYQQPPPAQTDTRSNPPPPPPPRPDQMNTEPAYAGSSSRPGLTSLIGGFYDARQWVTAAFRFADSFKNMELSWNQLLGKLAQITGYGDFTQIVDNIGDTYSSTSLSAPLSKTARTLSEGHKLYLAKGGARLNAYPLQPGDKSPVGVYLGAFASYGKFFGPDADHWAIESIDGVMNMGGEGGLFMKYASGGDMIFIPRVAFQFDRETWMVSEADSNPSINLKRVLVSLEMNYKGIIPGISLLMTDSEIEGEGFTTHFGFNLSYAL